MGNKPVGNKFIFCLFLIGNLCFHASLYAQWVQMGADIVGSGAGETAGNAVSMDSLGNTVAIGSPYNDQNGSNAGCVCVFDYNGSEWLQRGDDLLGEWYDDLYGKSVSLSSDGDILAVGTGNHLYNNAGAVHIYKWDGQAWKPKGFPIIGKFSNEQYGRVLSLNPRGDIVVVGVIGNWGSTGHACVYNWNGFAWVQKGKDIAGEAMMDEFGRSVSISSDGNTIAVGARLNDGNGEDAGHVRVLDWFNNEWVRRGDDIDGVHKGDQLGCSVGLSSDGNTLAVGAPNSNQQGTSTGSVRVFDWNGNVWLQRGNDLVGDKEADMFGDEICLSKDGNKLVVGACGGDSNGSLSGTVKIYKWNGAYWQQEGPNFNGDNSNDYFGFSVSFNGNGDRIIVGAIQNSGIKNGYARMFTMSGVGIPPKVLSADITVFPNPSKGVVKIETEGKDISSVRIYSPLGSVLLDKNFEGGSSHTVSLPENKGVYFLEILLSSNQYKWVKVIKE